MSFEQNAAGDLVEISENITGELARQIQELWLRLFPVPRDPAFNLKLQRGTPRKTWLIIAGPGGSRDAREREESLNFPLTIAEIQRATINLVESWRKQQALVRILREYLQPVFGSRLIPEVQQEPPTGSPQYVGLKVQVSSGEEKKLLVDVDQWGPRLDDFHRYLRDLDWAEKLRQNPGPTAYLKERLD